MGFLVEVRSLAPKIVDILASQNITTVEEVVCVGAAGLAETTSLPLQELEAFVEAVQFAYAAPVTRGDVWLHERDPLRPCPTGCARIDALLEGGFHSDEIAEVAGPSASGKSQLCMQTAIATCAVGKGVVFFDSGNAFDLERVRQLTLAHGHDLGVLSRLRRFQVPNINSLLSMLDQLYILLSSSDDEFFDNVGLIVVDSIGSLLAPVVGGAQQLGHSMMQCTALALRRISWTFHTAVLIANHAVSADRDGILKPALGETWRLEPAVQLWLQALPMTSTDRTDVTCEATLRKSNKSEVGRVVRLTLGERGHT